MCGGDDGDNGVCGGGGGNGVSVVAVVVCAVGEGMEGDMCMRACVCVCGIQEDGGAWGMDELGRVR